MSSVNANVGAGYVFVFDAEGKAQITLERLNLLGVPIVTVNLAGKVAAEDLVAGAVIASKLADAIADQLMTVSVTVAAEASNNVDVSIQVKDCQGNNLAQSTLLHLWLTASNSSLAPAALPSSGAPSILTSNGTIIQAMTASAPGLYLTDSTGLLNLRFTEAGALTKYLQTVVQSKLVQGSGALIWTA